MLAGPTLRETGQSREARKLKPPCEGSFRFKCSTVMSPGQRPKFFSDYWQLGSYERQRDFICTNVIDSGDKNERQTRRYMLPAVLPETNGNAEMQERYVQVCKVFFMNTVRIGSKLIRYTLNAKRNGRFLTAKTFTGYRVNATKSGVFCSQDQRGRHTPHNFCHHQMKINKAPWKVRFVHTLFLSCFILHFLLFLFPFHHIGLLFSFCCALYSFLFPHLCTLLKFLWSLISDIILQQHWISRSSTAHRFAIWKPFSMRGGGGS